MLILSMKVLVSEFHPHQPAGVAGHPGGQWERLSGGDGQEVSLAAEFPTVPGTEGQRQTGDVFLQTSQLATRKH